MAILYTADGSTTDSTFGGGYQATWTKTFTDHQRGMDGGANYHMPGQTAYAASTTFPFAYAITVLPRNDPGTGAYDSDGGNRYYPVSFMSGGVRRAGAGPNLLIYRHYSQSSAYQFEVANSVDIGWTGSSTHMGGLYSSFITGDSAWSDMSESQCTRHRMSYHSTISSFGMKLSWSADRGSGPFYVMLRGGFTYYISSSYPSNPCQVTAGGSVFSYSGNNAYNTWPASTLSVDNSIFSGTLTSMG
jgi:hypothetical protein|tara:strand:+ start:311 stop:1045 length:735 start_codon:yes stop_codon:yes gene_type:complete